MPQTIHLDGPTDIAGFKHAARRLLVQGVPPEALIWSCEDEGTLWGAESELDAPAAAEAPQPPASLVRVPPAFVALCERVLLHREPRRFALMYRLLWRLTHEPRLRGDPLDPDWRLAEGMARAVDRDIHKMRAFVRFTPVWEGEQGGAPGGQPGEEPRHIAWFEPQHHIVEANADFFRRRFAQMRWAILTPERCVEWDGQALQFRPGARREEAPAPDAGAAFWLTYYQHIFNPARLKLAQMRKEMPQRYWHNLPEARLIAPLSQAATARCQGMVAAEPTAPRPYKPMQSGLGEGAAAG